jgi:hypothetical protein
MQGRQGVDLRCELFGGLRHINASLVQPYSSPIGLRWCGGSGGENPPATQLGLFAIIGISIIVCI